MVVFFKSRRNRKKTGCNHTGQLRVFTFHLDENSSRRINRVSEPLENKKLKLIKEEATVASRLQRVSMQIKAFETQHGT